jgi:RimJ/RimL family protein N-acetyltransferase
MTDIRFETERLIIRPFELSDAEVFSAYRSDPSVARYQCWDAPYSLEKSIEFIQHMQQWNPQIPGEWLQLAMVRKDTGAMIGDCAFCILEDGMQAEIGMTLSRDAQGFGFGREATHQLLAYLFDELGMKRVRANCDPRNLPSWRVLERVGLRREAHMLQSTWIKGEWTDDYWYAMLAEEWQERKRLKD